MADKFGVLADIHANALALEAVLHDAARRSISRFVNLGDILYGPLEPQSTFEILQRSNVIATIRGNQDREIFEATEHDLASNKTLAFVTKNLGFRSITWLQSLPATAVVDEEVFLCHGTPNSDTTYLLEDVSSGRPQVRSGAAIQELLVEVRQPLILCAHSHIPRVVQLSNEQLIVNPGSVGVPAYEDSMPVPHVMENFSHHASYAEVEKSNSGWRVSFHRVAYKWREAAKQARALGREDWARAIATGREEQPRER